MNDLLTLRDKIRLAMAPHVTRNSRRKNGFAATAVAEAVDLHVRAEIQAARASAQAELEAVRKVNQQLTTQNQQLREGATRQSAYVNNLRACYDDMVRDLGITQGKLDTARSGHIGIGWTVLLTVVAWSVGLICAARLLHH